MDNQLNKDAKTLRIALKRLVRIYQFRDRNKVQSFTSDLTVNQFYIIELIIKNNSMGIVDLTKKLYLNKSTTSRIVDQLMKKGFVEKDNNLEDGRSINLNITKKGLKTYMKISNSEISRFKNYLKDRSPDVRFEINRLINQVADDAEAAFIK